MTTIELQESVVTRLSTQAAALGLSLEAYLEKLSNERFFQNGKLPRLTGEELERLLDEEASDNTTYQGTYPRADVYVDHD